ncbi:uncharacterized protein PAN0_002d1005 [Moesziomyces antarcticus]|uniref:uncharacterized protein n=1 Tax=Pseudozyma antarctica TaxID=84753 RepID=UPI00071957F6|nr:uncharacterized protein PAN0_002d1005 [Moesziomyces antarcticus]GAK62803.1 hypothetical protein PAN0_002d1005 [Moesziomyces antarcticus]
MLASRARMAQSRLRIGTALAPRTKPQPNSWQAQLKKTITWLLDPVKRTGSIATSNLGGKLADVDNEYELDNNDDNNAALQLEDANLSTVPSAGPSPAGRSK